MANEVYTFARLTRADFPQMLDWLSQPHVRAWWGAPDAELALLEQALDSDQTDLRLVLLGGRAFAFVQDYAVPPGAEASAEGAPYLAAYPPGSRGMDTFLGAPDLLGQGHAARYLRQRAEALLAEGAARLVIDPDPSNERAVRAYRRAGFRDRLLTSTPGGTAVLVMDYDPAAPVAPLLQNHPGPVPDRQNP